jgi:hypothetical protein
VKQIRKLPVLWYYALKMRSWRKLPSNPPLFGADPGLMVRVAASTESPYADPGEW